MEKFYNCHTHVANKQTGGFLIALDGVRGSEGGYSNSEVLEKAKKAEMIPVQYITGKKDENLETSIIKYHPRREGYTPDSVRESIQRNSPKAVIIDTLNQPFWQPNDYWNLAMAFPNIQFLFSHAGGFDIVDFLRITMFQKNVWIDFSFTQHVFGWCGKNVPMPLVVEHIEYAMKEKKLYDKLLFGSDSMRGEEDLTFEALESYKKFDSYKQVKEDNFLKFLEVCAL